MKVLLRNKFEYIYFHLKPLLLYFLSQKNDDKHFPKKHNSPLSTLNSQFSILAEVVL